MIMALSFNSAGINHLFLTKTKVDSNILDKIQIFFCGQKSFSINSVSLDAVSLCSAVD